MKPSLSVRQVQILSMIAKGMTNQEIGKALHITEDTVKQHVVKIRARLGAPDRASAVDQGWRQGYLGMWRVGVDWSATRKDVS